MAWLCSQPFSKWLGSFGYQAISVAMVQLAYIDDFCTILNLIESKADNCSRKNFKKLFELLTLKNVTECHTTASESRCVKTYYAFMGQISFCGSHAIHLRIFRNMLWHKALYIGTVIPWSLKQKSRKYELQLTGSNLLYFLAWTYSLT